MNYRVLIEVSVVVIIAILLFLFLTSAIKLNSYNLNNAKNTTNNVAFDNPVGSGQQFISCFNLDPMQCQNNPSCNLGPGNVCVNNM